MERGSGAKRAARSMDARAFPLAQGDRKRSAAQRRPEHRVGSWTRTDRRDRLAGGSPPNSDLRPGRQDASESGAESGVGCVRFMTEPARTERLEEPAPQSGGNCPRSAKLGGQPRRGKRVHPYLAKMPDRCGPLPLPAQGQPARPPAARQLQIGCVPSRCADAAPPPFPPSPGSTVSAPPASKPATAAPRRLRKKPAGCARALSPATRQSLGPPSGGRRARRRSALHRTRPGACPPVLASPCDRGRRVVVRARRIPPRCSGRAQRAKACTASRNFLVTPASSLPARGPSGVRERAARSRRPPPPDGPPSRP
jgi:hypothetical protein